jgi:NAD-dependent deacetylase
MDENYIKAAALIKSAQSLIAFTGAGVSVESGIPSFRGENGIWSKYDPQCLELDYFFSQPKDAWIVIKEIFYDFFGAASPNKAHEVLAQMEKEGMLQCVVTQNIDNLHQEAGSREVYEFHGNSQKMICTQCGKTYWPQEVDLNNLPPLCSDDRSILKPDFVFFGEGIPEVAYQKSFEAARNADVVLVIGTTGEVMPASMIPMEAKRNGATIIEINTETSNYSNQITDIFLRGAAGEVLAKLGKMIF